MDKVMMIRLALALIIGGSLGAVLGYYGKCTTGSCPLTANPWRGGLYGMVLAGLFAFSLAPAGTVSNSQAVDSGPSPVLHINSVEDFDKYVLQAEKPVLADFYSDICPPCRMLAPTIDQLAMDFQDKAVIAKINVQHVPALAKRYNVYAVPTVLFLKAGQETERKVGLESKKTYTDILKQLTE
jgi:thioredoxin 1